MLWVCVPCSAVVKNPSASAGDAEDEGSVLGSGRSPGVVNGNPLQYSCLEKSMDRGAWWATVHGVLKSWNDWMTEHTYRVCLANDILEIDYMLQHTSN